MVAKARCGDLIRVMICVNDIWDGLEVRNFQMTLLHKDPLPVDETSPKDIHRPMDKILARSYPSKNSSPMLVAKME